MFEAIITLYFWTNLWEDAHKEPRFAENPFMMAGLVLDHSVPISLLIFDYIFMNANPILVRHLWIVMACSTTYLIVNMTCALTWQPVYPAMTWRGVQGLLLPLIILLLGICIFLIFAFLNLSKLSKLGYSKFTETIEDNAKIGAGFNNRGKSVIQGRVAQL